MVYSITGNGSLCSIVIFEKEVNLDDRLSSNFHRIVILFSLIETHQVRRLTWTYMYLNELYALQADSMGCRCLIKAKSASIDVTKAESPLRNFIYFVNI